MMKKMFSHYNLLKAVLLILITTLLVSCTNQLGALYQNAPDQSAIPGEPSVKTRASNQNDSEQATLPRGVDEKAEAENQDASIQPSIPEELLGQWEVVDSYILDDDSAMHSEWSDIEILVDGFILISIPPDGYSEYNMSVARLKILSGNRLLLYNDSNGLGIVESFNVNQNQLRLSIGDEYYLYQRKVSN
ncbi:MAG TPA: hypothetical protein PLH64_09770 [Anaerolineaceae bacterium]|nr:hypothetical protein [Anaerolineaceae bacterium]